MQKSIYAALILSFVLFFSSGFAQNKGAVEPKNHSINKIEDKKEELKKPADTLKEKAPVVPLVQMDSVVEYKGKFKPYKKNAHASYYADRFHGKRTASGKIFNMNALTAAHKKLPFGTLVKVTNEANGKIVVVEITDRGPFVKGREIDLSKRAFMTITGNKKSGIATVTLEILQK